MKKAIGNQLCITGVLILLTSFAWAAFDAELAFAVRSLGAALIVSGLGVRVSALSFGRVVVKWLGLLLLVPPLFALPLLSFFQVMGQSLLPHQGWCFWFLGLLAACGVVFVVSGSEHAPGLSAKQQRAYDELAWRLGRAYPSTADVLQTRWHGFLLPLYVAAGCAFAVGGAGLPSARLPVVLLGSALIVAATNALHELAHTLWGMVMGYDVTEIRVGGGPVVLRVPLGSVALELRLLPVHGRVRFAFNETAALRGLRSVAWAGPVSGLLPALLGILGMLFFERHEAGFWISVSGLIAGACSLAQLIPNLGRRVSYRDGTWLFSNEAVRRQTWVLLELARFSAGQPASAEALAELPRFSEFWEPLTRASDAERRARLLAAIESVTSDAEASPLTESPLCEPFARGVLSRFDAEG